MSTAKCSVCGRKYYYEAGATRDLAESVGMDWVLSLGKAAMGKKNICSDCRRAGYTDKCSGSGSGGFGGGAFASGSSSGGSSVGSGAGAGLAGVGIGLAGAGAGAALKGIGSLFNGLGKGAGAMGGAMGDLMKSGVKQSAEANADFRTKKKKVEELVFSSNPEEYQSQLSWLMGFTQAKSIDMGDMMVADAAKARLCTEFDRIMVADPALYAQYAAIHASLKKKKSFGMKIGIFMGAMVLIVLVTTIPALVISGNKTKTETMRLEAIVKEIDDAIAQKDYDAALYKATKLQWTFEASQHSSEVEAWNEQREKITETIKELSGK